MGHVAYDIRAARKDINVIFPLTRFRELAQEGVIGALAQRNYSYHGLTTIPRLMQESAPQVQDCESRLLTMGEAKCVLICYFPRIVATGAALLC